MEKGRGREKRRVRRKENIADLSAVCMQRDLRN